MIDVIKDTLIDGVKLLPFLFIAYLIMEYLEHKTGNKSKDIVKKSGKYGPIWGGLLGIFPQCGFSAAAANLYAGRVITIGTLFAVFLSTSDEMLPILISEAVPISLILKILICKLIIAIIVGLVIDKLINHNKDFNSNEIKHLCEDEHCDCNHSSILKSSIKHTLNIFLFILIITFIINSIIYIIGEENLSNLILNIPFVGAFISGLIGLIPNCAGSVIITELYLSNLISFGTMISGLLVSSGIGILVLFKSNKNIKENLKILFTLYIIGVFFGIIIDLILS